MHSEGMHVCTQLHYACVSLPSAHLFFNFCLSFKPPCSLSLLFFTFFSLFLASSGGADLQLGTSALGLGARLKREDDTPSGRRERPESIQAIQGPGSEESKARLLIFYFLSSSSFFQGKSQTRFASHQLSRAVTSSQPLGNCCS